VDRAVICPLGSADAPVAGSIDFESHAESVVTVVSQHVVILCDEWVVSGGAFTLPSSREGEVQGAA